MDVVVQPPPGPRNPGVLPQRAEVQRWFATLFNKCDTAGAGRLSGAQIKPLFDRSGLAQEVLSQVWRTAVMARPGPVQSSLDLEQFGLALLLIAAAQAGRPVALGSVQLTDVPAFQGIPPPPPPQQQQPAVASAAPSQAAGMTLSEQERAGYLQYFRVADLDGDGFLSGQEAFAFFRRSGLPDQAIVHVVRLADADRDKRLSPTEFAAAMHLVMLHSKRGVPLPESLPPGLLLARETTGLGLAVPPLQQLPQSPAVRPASSQPVSSPGHPHPDGSLQLQALSGPPGPVGVPLLPEPTPGLGELHSRAQRALSFGGAQPGSMPASPMPHPQQQLQQHPPAYPPGVDPAHARQEFQRLLQQLARIDELQGLVEKSFAALRETQDRAGEVGSLLTQAKQVSAELRDHTHDAEMESERLEAQARHIQEQIRIEESRQAILQKEITELQDGPLREARAQLDLLNAELEQLRAQRLAEQPTGLEAVLEQRRAELSLAHAETEGLRSQLQQLQAEPDPVEQQRSAQQLEIDGLQADLEQLREERRRMTEQRSYLQQEQLRRAQLQEERLRREREKLEELGNEQRKLIADRQELMRDVAQLEQQAAAAAAEPLVVVPAPQEPRPASAGAFEDAADPFGGIAEVAARPSSAPTIAAEPTPAPTPVSVAAQSPGFEDDDPFAGPSEPGSPVAPAGAAVASAGEPDDPFGDFDSSPSSQAATALASPFDEVSDPFGSDPWSAMNAVTAEFPNRPDALEADEVDEELAKISWTEIDDLEGMEASAAADDLDSGVLDDFGTLDAEAVFGGGFDLSQLDLGANGLKLPAAGELAESRDPFAADPFGAVAPAPAPPAAITGAAVSPAAAVSSAAASAEKKPKKSKKAKQLAEFNFDNPAADWDSFA